MPDFNPQDDIDDLYTYLDHFIYKNHLVDRKFYIIGESYGGHRAIGLADKFLEHLMTIDGLVLISPAVSSPLNTEEPDIYLPTIASILQYHGLISRQDYKDICHFAHHCYRSALSLYPEIPPELKKEIVRNVSQLTLIPESRLRHNHLKFSENDFMMALLEQENLMIDEYDGRYATRSEHEGIEDKYSQRQPLLLYYAPAVQTFRNWLSSQGFSEPRSYQWQSVQPVSEYFEKYAVGGKSDIHRMKDFLLARPDTKIMITCGKYDQVIPCRSVERATHQLRAQFGDRVTIDLYDSGHMPYIDPAQRKKLVDKIKSNITP